MLPIKFLIKFWANLSKCLFSDLIVAGWKTLFWSLFVLYRDYFLHTKILIDLKFDCLQHIFSYFLIIETYSWITNKDQIVSCPYLASNWVLYRFLTITKSFKLVKFGLTYPNNDDAHRKFGGLNNFLQGKIKIIRTPISENKSNLILHFANIHLMSSAVRHQLYKRTKIALNLLFDLGKWMPVRFY